MQQDARNYSLQASKMTVYNSKRNNSNQFGIEKKLNKNTLSYPWLSFFPNEKSFLLLLFVIFTNFTVIL